MKIRPFQILAVVLVLTIAAAVLFAQTASNYTWTANVNTTHPAAPRATFQTVVAAGLPATIDNATITNPVTQITRSGTSLLTTQGRGTFLVVRLAYDAGLTAITAPTVKVFGRGNSGEPWRILRTRGGALNAQLLTAATDATDGTLDYTTPDLTTNVWDLQGCDQILVGVEAALAGTGTTSNARIEALVQ
jgi:hypothetical protein